jgi:hypothetical protein
MDEQQNTPMTIEEIEQHLSAIWMILGSVLSPRLLEQAIDRSRTPEPDNE